MVSILGKSRTTRIEIGSLRVPKRNDHSRFAAQQWIRGLFEGSRVRFHERSGSHTEPDIPTVVFASTSSRRLRRSHRRTRGCSALSSRARRDPRRQARTGNRDARVPPHVLIIPSEEFLPPESHLAGIFQLHQANALVAAGFKVGVISLRLALSVPMIVRSGLYRLAGRSPGNALDGRSIPELATLLKRKMMDPESFITYDQVGEIPVVRAEAFYFFPPSPTTDHIGWVRSGVAAFKAYCERFGRPDVIHAHNLNPAGLLAHRISKESKIPYVVTEHSTFYARGLMPRAIFGRLRKAAEGADTMAAVSPQLGKLVADQFKLDPRQIRCVPNVIDPFLVTAPAATRASVRRGVEFLCVGNLIPIKNHAVLLRAFHEAFKGDSRVTLRIGGDGPLEAELKTLSSQLGLE